MKKRQVFLKSTSEGRQRAKQKRHEEELERERRNQQDEQRRSYVLDLIMFFLIQSIGSGFKERRLNSYSWKLRFCHVELSWGISI